MMSANTFRIEGRFEPPVDWKAGELAECILRGPWRRVDGPHELCGPAFGEVRIVERVVLQQVWLGRPPILLLGFARYGVALYSAEAFRKIVPRADAAERADRAFLRDLTGAPSIEREREAA